MDLSTIPTFGGYAHVFGPTECYPRVEILFDDGRERRQPVDISTDALLLAFHARQLQANARPAQWRWAGPVRAVVHQNFWRVTCPACGDMPPCGPTYSVACCMNCGAILEQVVYPAEWPAIEAALLKRHALATRGWLTHETLADLHAENAAHDVGVAR